MLSLKKDLFYIAIPLLISNYLWRLLNLNNVPNRKSDLDYFIQELFIMVPIIFCVIFTVSYFGQLFLSIYDGNNPNFKISLVIALIFAMANLFGSIFHLLAERYNITKSEYPLTLFTTFGVLIGSLFALLLYFIIYQYDKVLQNINIIPLLIGIFIQSIVIGIMANANSRQKFNKYLDAFIFAITTSASYLASTIIMLIVTFLFSKL
uniref:Uncharacterized protein n=1 Tax=viral metagenome TaxID=1070528 RepID=A0A6C0E7L5_9ZZZZ